MFTAISIYLFPLIISFLFGIAILSALIYISSFIKDIRNSKRHIHKKGIIRLGGIAIISSFILGIFLDNNLVIDKPIAGIIIALIFILILGVWDDLRELGWKTQFFFQISLVIFIFIMGIRIDYITNPLGGIVNLENETFFLPSLLLVLGWVVISMNSMNWIDGIDGLSGGITLIGALTIFFLSLKPEVNQPPVGIISAALIGSILAFLVFNFNPSRIMAGTSGSMFFGFILAVLAIFAGTKIATALLIMTVPIVDAFWVIFERIRNGKSIFEPDKRHLHHKLLELGWSQRKICLFFYFITSVVAVIALNTRAIGKLITISFSVGILIGALYLINKKIYAKTS